MARTLTNNSGLPKPIYDAVANDPYSRGNSDISITSLSKPPRIVSLEEHYADQIEEDAADRIYSLLGQLMHLLLERASYQGSLKMEDLVVIAEQAKSPETGLIDLQRFVKLAFRHINKSHLVEERLFAELGGWRISGQTDSLIFDVENGVIDDYKFVSAWQIKDGVKADYESQLNSYRYLAHVNGIVIKKIRIVAILRDWSKGKAQRERDYPQKQIMVLDIPIWEIEHVRSFLEDRILAHQKARKRLPLCTEEDRWARPTVWAVKHKDRVKALRLHNSSDSAERHAASVAGAYVEVRKGKNVRCEDYCSVSVFCEQFKRLKEKELAAEGRLVNPSPKKEENE